jgi:hypothetical protein
MLFYCHSLRYLYISFTEVGLYRHIEISFEGSILADARRDCAVANVGHSPH